MKERSFSWRIASLLIIFMIFFFIVIARLFYWQVLASESLSKLAKNQYHSQREIISARGEIFSLDNFPLVTNKKAYLLYASLVDLEESFEQTAASLAPFLVAEEELKATVSASGKKKSRERVKKEKIKINLIEPD